jgi:hypothetical protein
MEIKNLCDSHTKQEMISRINKLRVDSKPLWGKMSVAQMLAHIQVPMSVTLGKKKVSQSFMGMIFGPFVKSMMYNEKPWKQGMPTDRSFVIRDDRDFEKEKQGLIKLINEFEIKEITSDKHPFFGHMTKEQWAKSNWKHLDHHMKQFGV